MAFCKRSFSAIKCLILLKNSASVVLKNSYMTSEMIPGSGLVTTLVQDGMSNSWCM